MVERIVKVALTDQSSDLVEAITKPVRVPSRFLIYGLIDPTNCCLFYIGKTHKPRQFRLREHVECATLGDSRPVYDRIRAMAALGVVPDIFVLERVPGSTSWQEAEARHIRFWCAFDLKFLPMLWPPMTPKSGPTEIAAVDLLNVTYRPLRT